MHPGVRMTATSPAPERYLEEASKASEYLHKVFAGWDPGTLLGGSSHLVGNESPAISGKSPVISGKSPVISVG